MGALKAIAIAVALFGSAPSRAKSVADWRPYITEASTRFGVPVAWIERVMQAESAGRTTLGGRSITSRAGAMGLMQLMPATWAEMRAAYALGDNPHDPHDNIIAGTAYLRAMYDRFGYPGLFAAYNAGPGRYAAYLAGTKTLPGETRAYIATVSDATVTASQARAQSARPTLFAVLHAAMPLPQAAAADAPSPGLFVPLSTVLIPIAAAGKRACLAAVSNREVGGLVSGRPSMAAGGASVQGRRPLQFCREMVRASHASLFVFDATKSAPPPPLRGASAALRQP